MAEREKNNVFIEKDIIRYKKAREKKKERER